METEPEFLSLYLVVCNLWQTQERLEKLQSGPLLHQEPVKHLTLQGEWSVYVRYIQWNLDLMKC